jgi:hypothetical protein
LCASVYHKRGQQWSAVKGKSIKNVKDLKFAGDLKRNYLLAVAILREHILPSCDFLTGPIVPQTLCATVKKTHFNDDLDMTENRIRKATKINGK